MPTLRASIDVAADPAAVWPYVADLTRHPAWAADPLEVTAAGDGRYRSVARSKGREFTADLVVTEADEPRAFGFTATDATGRYAHRFTLAPAPGGGTRVTREARGELSPAQAALFWAVYLPVKRPNARRALARLKELVERNG